MKLIITTSNLPETEGSYLKFEPKSCVLKSFEKYAPISFRTESGRYEGIVDQISYYANGNLEINVIVKENAGRGEWF